MSMSPVLLDQEADIKQVYYIQIRYRGPGR